MSFVAELKRRNVLRIAGLYLVGSWLVVQVASTLLPIFDAPGWASRTVVIVLAIGFVPALVFAWVFELTPEGLKREKDVDRTGSIRAHTGRRLDRVIMVALAVALAYFAFDKFVLAPQREAALRRQKGEEVAAARAQGRSDALVESYGDKSIAVLPFVDLSPNKDQEYFSDGISEELLNLLAKNSGLRVISRSSAFSFKGKNLEIPEIARRLNVAHVLEGSVRKAGDRVRVTAQLIDARTDTNQWSEAYDRPLDDIFSVQEEIAAAVADQLKLRLLGAPPRADAVDPKAYALYLQARHLYQQGSPDAIDQSIALYRQALAIEPTYAAAWEGLSKNYSRQADFGLRPLDEGFELAREAAAKALSFDPNLAEAQADLGWIARTHDGNLVVAAQHYARALALAPVDPSVLRGVAGLAYTLGRIDQSIALLEQSTARDPVSSHSQFHLGISYLAAGRVDAAIDSFQTALLLSPDRPRVRFELGNALLLKGDSDAALDAMLQEPREFERLAGLAMAYHALGQPAQSNAALQELIDKHAAESAYTIAYVLAFRGENDQAFEWLDRATADRDLRILNILGNPHLARLRNDPRWLPLLRKIGMAPEQLAAIDFDVKSPQ